MIPENRKEDIMKVKAKMMGQYDGLMRSVGDVFDVDDKQPLASWMEKVEESKPEEPKVDSKKKDQRTEERDPFEHDQHKAEEKGWA